MEKLQETTTQPKKKVWRLLLLLIILGLAVNLLLPQLSNLTDAWQVLREMTWWAVGLAFTAEVVSYLGYGYCLHAIVALHRQKLSVPKGALVAISAGSIGLVAGGWFAIAGSTFSSIKKYTNDPVTATMAGLLPSLLMNVVIGVVAIAGITYLLLVKSISNSQLTQYLIFLALLGISTFGSMLAVFFPKPTFKVVNWVLWKWATLRKKPYDPSNTQEMIDSFVYSWKGLARGEWKKPLLGAVMYIGFDMLMMYILFLAAGYEIHAGVLLAGYGLPFLLSKIAFIFPGGIGIVEASMAAIFTSLGVPKEVSVVVILTYRLFAFWLPAILGFAAVGVISRDAAISPQEA